MKELTENQKRLANTAVNALKKLQSLGVETMVIDSGGGNSGLTFWRPTKDERYEAYEIVSRYGDPKHEEFEETSYYPSESIGLRIDIIVP